MNVVQPMMTYNIPLVTCKINSVLVLPIFIYYRQRSIDWISSIKAKVFIRKKVPLLCGGGKRIKLASGLRAWSQFKTA